MNSNRLALIAGLFFAAQAQGQQSSFFTDREAYRFQLAENLFQSKIYKAAQHEYARQYFYNQSLSNSQKEAAQFFDNVIGVVLEKQYAEKGLDAFLLQYPNSAYFAQASMPLADYYLAKKEFSKALDILLDINQYQLSREDNARYVLKLGYSKFMTGDTAGATEALQEAYAQSSGQTRSQIAYMLGHLYYAQGENQQAFTYFEQLRDEPTYSALVRPYYVQLHYNEKQYDMAIEAGTSLLNDVLSEEYRAEVHKIIGESYFMQNEYTQAYPHLKHYVDFTPEPTHSDLYQMGFVASQIGNFPEAVSYYNRIVNTDSPLAQNAYYQLGNAYLQADQKLEALSAFRSAYQMSYDADVKKKAHLQYAKLSYDIGNPFEAAPTVLQNYLENYPGEQASTEISALLVKSYLYSGNYKETLEAIDRLPSSTPTTDKIDQEVSFLLGTEEFNKGNMDAAEAYFLRSLEHKANTEFNLRAQYWLAQTYYQKQQYEQAQKGFLALEGKQFEESQQLAYDLAYSYFKNKQFDLAERYFTLYLSNPKEEFLQDARLRLADTYYANNKLSEALAIYEETENLSDYSLYQKAMAFGFKGDSMAKIQHLKELVDRYPDSTYKGDALYELGVAYSSNEDYKNAETYFSRVEKESSDMQLIANARIYRTQNLVDQNRNDEALKRFEDLALEYKNTAVAQRVVLAARPLYLQKGDVQGYQALAERAGVALDQGAIEEISLSAAKALYAEKKYQQAIPLYEKYLIENPSGQNLAQAQFELGESFYYTQQYSKAVLVFQAITTSPNDYTEQAQGRLAQIYLREENYEQAKPVLTALEKASAPALRSYALVELMKLAALEKNWKEAELLSQRVLKDTSNPQSIRELAQAIEARSLMHRGRDEMARKAYEPLERSSNTEVAAEALYAKAFYQNKAKAYKSSNETVFRLANNYASEQYWGAKALVVLASNYIGLKDNYQASYTIDQIIENYGDYPDVVAEARALKSKIK